MNAATSPSNLLPPTVPDCFPRGIKAERKLKTRDEYLQAAREAIPLLKANAKRCNEIRRPTDEAIQGLVKAGLYGLVRPKAYGGAGLELSDLFDVVSVLSEGCTSTAWAYNVQAVHDWLIGMMSKEGQDEIFGANELVISCGVFNPIGAKARAVEGGYMVSGRWNYGSGSTHSNFAACVADIEGRVHDGHPESRMMVLNRDQFQVLDTWHVRGLAGTGSHDIYIEEETFVPEQRTALLSDMAAGTAPGGKVHPDQLAFRVQVLAGAHLAAVATCFGAAKAAIEIYKQNTLKRVRAFTGAKEVESPAAAARIGRSVVEVEAAELLFKKTVQDLEADVRAGRETSLEFRAKLRMVTSYAPHVCREVITSLVDGSSASSFGAGSTLLTLLLDVSAATTHASLAYDNGPENYGRVLMGLEPSNPLI